MARLASDAIGGFFACPPEAVQLALDRLAAPPAGDFAILDPCAGEGAAISQLSTGLSAKPEHVYAIELEGGRSESVKIALPGASVLAPCSFFGCDVRYSSFSFIWCNPHFSEQLGGGRAETRFLSRSLSLLAPGGVIAFVCPEQVAKRPEIQDLFLCWTEKICQFPFPPAVRRFREVITMGRVLKEPADYRKLRWPLECKVSRNYTLPESPGPGSRFTKTELTEDELVAALERSPLRKRLEPPDDKERPSPPLALGAGHLALLLASGHLDGLIHPPGEPPHVVRGTAIKVSEPTDTEIDETKNETKTKITYTERVVLTVRVATAEADIVTLQ